MAISGKNSCGSSNDNDVIIMVCSAQQQQWQCWQSTSISMADASWWQLAASTSIHNLVGTLDESSEWLWWDFILPIPNILLPREKEMSDACTQAEKKPPPKPPLFGMP